MSSAIRIAEEHPVFYRPVRQRVGCAFFFVNSREGVLALVRDEKADLQRMMQEKCAACDQMLLTLKRLRKILERGIDAEPIMLLDTLCGLLNIPVRSPKVLGRRNLLLYFSNALHLRLRSDRMIRSQLQSEENEALRRLTRWKRH